ncbi:hypothetical protein P691DRAFT_777988 [Macrolepiota fuliginosa MF-IS2]|uniref:Uncharacterized protein n=1 Tax=Macrolepiota fuliginosa MF-IS2 TaxID=1400762 RepID=A0A9P6C0R2_9AGAR|nr:hypothetical protein P691DRAFT_777988 [Macrolepiota fuliginosa MF-IS2]
MVLISRELVNLYGMTIYMVDVFICSLLAGSIITLGVSCVILLARGKERMSKQHQLLRIYVIALLFLIVGVEVEIFLATGILLQPLHQAEPPFDTMMITLYLTILAVCALTNGILVWRCFMIHRGLRHSLLANYGHVVWIFPACLSGLGLAIGSIACGVHLQHWALNSKLVSAAFALDVVLTLYTTTLITATLLMYRRTVKSLPAGTSSTRTQPLPIIAILLESAATNIPGAIAVVVGFGEKYGLIILPIVTVNQALTSVLIIHQVALGRAFSHQGEERVEGTAPLAFQGGEGNGQDLSGRGI